MTLIDDHQLIERLNQLHVALTYGGSREKAGETIDLAIARIGLVADLTSARRALVVAIEEAASAIDRAREALDAARKAVRP